MLAALSVCEGGFGLELAEALGGAIGLSDSDVARAVADLWDQSLLSTEGSVPESPYRMLALIREYSSSQLDLDGNRPAAARAHAAYFANVITRLGTCPYGPEESETIVAVETEFDNIRQAFGWCLTEERWDRAMEMLDALVPELVLRDRIEVGRWAAETLATLGETEHPVLGVGVGPGREHGAGGGSIHRRRIAGPPEPCMREAIGGASNLVGPKRRRSPARRKFAFRGG